MLWVWGDWHRVVLMLMFPVNVGCYYSHFLPVNKAQQGMKWEVASRSSGKHSVTARKLGRWLGFCSPPAGSYAFLFQM